MDLLTWLRSAPDFKIRCFFTLHTSASISTPSKGRNVHRRTETQSKGLVVLYRHNQVTLLTSLMICLARFLFLESRSAFPCKLRQGHYKSPNRPSYHNGLVLDNTTTCSQGLPNDAVQV